MTRALGTGLRVLDLTRPLPFATRLTPAASSLLFHELHQRRPDHA